MTPQQVVAHAFNTVEAFDHGLISESILLSAQQKFILPALGRELFEAVEKGMFPDLLDNYIKTPLAIYVRLLLLPTLTAQMGATGVMQHRSANFLGADQGQIAALRQSLRSDAVALMHRALDHISANGALYPMFNPHDSILNLVSINSGVVI